MRSRQLLHLLLLPLFSLSLLLNAFTPLAFAQSVTPTRLDITVTPYLFDLTAKPGETIHNTFRIRNNTNSPLNLAVTVKKLVPNGKGDLPMPEEPSSADSYISWVKFDHPTFTALPQEWTDIKYTIAIPADAAYGYYYVFQIAPQKAPLLTGSGAALQGQVLIVTLVNVQKEGAKLSAKLLEFKPESFINQYLPVTFVTRVTNTGNVHLRPRGNIFIRGFGEKDLATLEVNQAMGAVLPNGNRTFTASWNDGFLVKEPVMEDGKVKMDKNGQPVTNLKINWNKLTDFRIGHYTASLLLVYDAGTHDESLDATTDFWVIPYTAIGILLGGLIIIILILRFLLRSYVNREVSKQRRSR